MDRERVGRKVLTSDYEGLPAAGVFPNVLLAALYQTTGISLFGRWGGFWSWKRAERWLHRP
jgi:hypothetical protein